MNLNYSIQSKRGRYFLALQFCLNVLLFRDIKNVAEALDLAMKEESKSPYRIAAVELIGRAFSVWCPYINAGNVLRSILHSTGLGIQPSNVGAPTHTNNSTATAATGSIDHSSANITNVSAATSTSSINANTSSASIASAAPPPLHPALIVASKLAVAQIAASNSSLFVSTITFDLSHSKSATERSDCLKLLGLFISKVAKGRGEGDSSSNYNHTILIPLAFPFPRNLS